MCVLLLAGYKECSNPVYGDTPTRAQLLELKSFPWKCMLPSKEAPLVMKVLGKHAIGMPHPNSAGEDIILQVSACSQLAHVKREGCTSRNCLPLSTVLLWRLTASLSLHLNLSQRAAEAALFGGVPACTLSLLCAVEAQRLLNCSSKQ